MSRRWNNHEEKSQNKEMPLASRLGATACTMISHKSEEA
jgi:hypothetical protein